MKYGWAGAWTEPTLATAPVPVRHTCAASATEFARLEDRDDTEYGNAYGIAYRDGAWRFYNDEYYGFDLPVRYCPYCGTDLTTIPTEGRGLGLVERRAG